MVLTPAVIVLPQKNKISYLFFLLTLAPRQAMSNSHSSAVFKARALEVGVSQEIVDLLEAGHINTMSRLAFLTSYQPGQSDDSPLMSKLEEICTRELQAFEKASLRHLFFECATVTMAELRQQVEAGDSAEPAQVPIAERIHRIKEQKARLTGVLFSIHSEPSYKLVDAVFQMISDGQIVWIKWEKLTSRVDEVQTGKPQLSFNFDANGHLKLNQKQRDSQCCLTGEIQTRQALQRRSLAFDLASLIEYNVQEKWHETMFQALNRVAPAGYRSTSMDQCREADKHLWLLLSDEVRGSLKATATDARPVQSAFVKLSESAEIRLLLQPLPKAPQDTAKWRPSPYDDREKDKKGKGKSKGKQKSDGFELPAGCSPTTKDGKPICFNFNRNRCSRAKAGKRCDRGFHVCWRENCNLPRAFGECTHSSWDSDSTCALMIPEISAQHNAVKPDAPDDSVQSSFPNANACKQSKFFHRPPLVIEIFSGCSRLSSIAKARGFDTLAIDHFANKHTPVHDVFPLELTEAEDQGILLELIATRRPHAVHLAPECGTANRAREKSLNACESKSAPKPLRDFEHPFGKPDLSEPDSKRVFSANKLYKLCAKILYKAFLIGFTISVENPARSWFWMVLTKYVLEINDTAFHCWYNNLTPVQFSSCAHGGARPNMIRWLSTHPMFLPTLLKSAQERVLIMCISLSPPSQPYLLPLRLRQNILICFAKGLLIVGLRHCPWTVFSYHQSLFVCNL